MTESGLGKALMQEEQHDEQYDKHIIKIGQDVNSLADMMTDLNTLVLAQDDPLNRIDTNIENSLSKVKSADKELVKADDYSRSSSRNSNLIICILVAIVVGLSLFIGIRKG